MTTGSTSNSNHHALQPRDDRETLSALFDGELSTDAMRFALKRLDHDAGWRDTCGRWQVIGDALRGEPSAAARPDFAAGVMRMLVDERQAAFAGVPASMQQAASPTQVGSRRRWAGGAALAASVAMAAVLVVRPFSEPATPAPGGEVVVSASATEQSPAQAEQAASPASLDSTVPTPAASPDMARSVAVADAPQATTSRGNSRTARAPSRPARGQSAPTPSTTIEAATVAAAAAPVTARQPFHPPVDDIVTRPWPRAALPDSTAAGALTVDFGAEPGSPSFYPFEPRLPLQEPAPVTPQATEPQR